jgi:hypothetical protein
VLQVPWHICPQPSGGGAAADRVAADRPGGCAARGAGGSHACGAIRVSLVPRIMDSHHRTSHAACQPSILTWHSCVRSNCPAAAACTTQWPCPAVRLPQMHGVWAQGEHRSERGPHSSCNDGEGAAHDGLRAAPALGGGAHLFLLFGRVFYSQLLSRPPNIACSGVAGSTGLCSSCTMHATVQHYQHTRSALNLILFTCRWV